MLFFTTDLPRKSCREPHPEHKTRLQPAPSRLLLLLPHNPGHTRTALPASPISADGSLPRGGTHGAPHGSFTPSRPSARRGLSREAPQAGPAHQEQPEPGTARARQPHRPPLGRPRPPRAASTSYKMEGGREGQHHPGPQLTAAEQGPPRQTGPPRPAAPGAAPAMLPLLCWPPRPAEEGRSRIPWWCGCAP